MAEPGNGGGEEDDYMGDLSRFLTPEASSTPKFISKKVRLMPCLVPYEIFSMRIRKPNSELGVHLFFVLALLASFWLLESIEFRVIANFAFVGEQNE
jgi:hypothetical protein